MSRPAAVAAIDGSRTSWLTLLILICANVAGVVCGGGSWIAALVGLDRTPGKRNRANSGTCRLKSDRLSRPAVSLQSSGGEEWIYAVSELVAIGAGAAAETTGGIIGDIVTAVGDRDLAVTARYALCQNAVGDGQRT